MVSSSIINAMCFTFEKLKYDVQKDRIAKSNENGDLHHDSVSTTIYGSRWASQDIPRFVDIYPTS